MGKVSSLVWPSSGSQDCTMLEDLIAKLITLFVFVRAESGLAARTNVM